MSDESVDSLKPNILIVDDTPVNLRALDKILAQEGYKIRKALSGEMALTACKTTLPDLILLDILMPDMDGYEVCRCLKADAKTKEIPVIFISALDDVFDKVKAFNAGGVDYISKPFQVEEVLARVKNHLTIVRNNLTIRQLNQQLAERNAQLQDLNQELMRSNSELEQFAYIASHDLRSPLQVIVGYADMLAWKYDSQLDEEADRYLREIIKASMRMKQLIQDLLNYSRVGMGMPELKSINCSDVLKDALANLQEEIAASRASISASKLPQVNGDRTQLIQLFQNLIGNSLKFRRPEVPLKIEIFSEASESGEWLFGVRDNGIGIAAANFECIFNIFQRLNHEKYSGTGIGTTICKKIVERHGGRIWVESQLEVETTFYFTLPSIQSKLSPKNL